MNVLFTIVIVAALAVWASAIYARLSRLRGQVNAAWALLEGNTSDVAVRNVYNKHVDLYNAALAAFPANIVGPAAGFKPARRFES